MAASMRGIVIPKTEMLPYPSIASNVQHIAYQEPGVIYNNSEFTYQYITYRGNALPRNRRGAVMESK